MPFPAPGDLPGPWIKPRSLRLLHWLANSLPLCLLGSVCVCVCVCVCMCAPTPAGALSHFSHVQLFGTLRTVAHQGLLSREFSRQEYRSGLPYPSPDDLLDPEMEQVGLYLLHWQMGCLPLIPPGKPYDYLTQPKNTFSSNYLPFSLFYSIIHVCLSYIRKVLTKNNFSKQLEKMTKKAVRELKLAFF